MAIIIPISHALELAKPTEGYVRTPGRHMSDIYGAWYKEADPKRYDKRLDDGSEEPMNLLKLELGTSFEEVFEVALMARLLGERPGEFCIHPWTHEHLDVDDPRGIIFSPDHLLFNGVTRLGEFKCTWYSCRYPIDDERFAKWFTQMRLYCFALRLRHARLYALFMNGIYPKWTKELGGAPTPQLLAWDIEFSQRELTNEWNLMMRFAASKGLIEEAA
jgi:hypothetical protein